MRDTSLSTVVIGLALAGMSACTHSDTRYLERSALFERTLRTPLREDLPSFPEKEALGQIQGRAAAASLLRRLRCPVPDGYEAADFPNAAIHPSSICNRADFGLPNTLVYAQSLEERWTFPVDNTGALHSPDTWRPTSAVVASPLQGWVASVGYHVFVDFTRHQGGHVSVGQDAPWKRMLFYVVRNPIFAVTDSQGHFTLPALPDGDYTLVAIHELLGKVEKKVSIKGANPRPVTFVFRVPPKLRSSGSGCKSGCAR